MPESDLIFETVADNTAQHPIYVAKLPGLLPEKDRFIIVSTLYHLGRARLMFEARGFKKFLCRAPRSVSVVCLGSPTEAVMRYSLWQNLDTGIKILREEIAILAFKCGRTE